MIEINLIYFVKFFFRPQQSHTDQGVNYFFSREIYCTRMQLFYYRNVIENYIVTNDNIS